MKAILFDGTGSTFVVYRTEDGVFFSGMRPYLYNILQSYKDTAKILYLNVNRVKVDVYCKGYDSNLFSFFEDFCNRIAENVENGTEKFDFLWDFYMKEN